MKTLLLIAETRTAESIGGKFLRAARNDDICQKWNTEHLYTSPATHYSPSMKTIAGKIFYRMAGKRSWEWWSFQNRLKEKINELKPELIIVTGILPLKEVIFETANQHGCCITNYLTDDPWNSNHKRDSFLRNIGKYHHIFSTKKELEDRLQKKGAQSTSWLPFAFDPEFHKPPLSQNQPSEDTTDLLFIGTGAKERLKWLDSLSELPNIKRRIHGDGWSNVKPKNWEVLGAVTGDEYCNVMYNSKITLGILREANKDLSTMRSYEIGAIGACGLYQDTTEHRELLKNYPDEGFFKNPEELKDRVKILLKNKSLRMELRRLGMEAIRNGKNTYEERLKEIIRQTQI